MQTLIRVALEKTMKEDFEEISIWQKLCAATSFDIPIYAGFMLVPYGKLVGVSVWELGNPYGNWNIWAGLASMTQCIVVFGIYYVLTNMVIYTMS